VSGLASPLAFALGWEGPLSAGPYFINLVPAPDAVGVPILDPVRISTRDAETYVTFPTLNAALGYAKVFSEGLEVFTELPRTKRGTLFPERPDGGTLVSLVSEGVEIRKTLDIPQDSVFFTALDVGKNLRSNAIFDIALHPGQQYETMEGPGPLHDSIMPGVLPVPYYYFEGEDPFAGVIGLEYGPRNTGVYVFFVDTGSGGTTSRVLRITGPKVGTTRVPDITINFNWSALRRYFLVWNEIKSTFDLFVESPTGVILLQSVPISSFQPFASSQWRHGGDADVVAVYGQEGIADNRMTIRSMAFATNAGFPLINGARHSDFNTTVNGAEYVSFLGSEDPRRRTVAPWLASTIEQFPVQAPQAVGQALRTGVFRMTKVENTVGSFAISREDPGLLKTQDEGFLLDVHFAATPAKRDNAGTGMGFLVYDGTSVFQLDLLDDGSARTVGLLRKNGVYSDPRDHLSPSSPLSWKTPAKIRFVHDPRANQWRMYNLATSYSTPVLTVSLDRSLLPSRDDYGYSTLPFVAFGHVVSTALHGNLDIYKLGFCGLYQGWEAASLPESSNPAFTAVGSGTAAMVQDSAEGKILRVTAAAGTNRIYTRTAPFGAQRGLTIEMRMRIASCASRSKSGSYLLVDDGGTARMLGFTETSEGRFIAVPLAKGLDDYEEVAVRQGSLAKFSSLLDWSVFHDYRLEWKPWDGFYVYVDRETEPRIMVPALRPGAMLPSTIYNVPTVGFGQFKEPASTPTVSEWKYLRTLLSSGYELSFKKNLSAPQLQEELFGTKAIVIVHAEDAD